MYNCLESISRYVNLDYEVIVADNHSADSSVSECEKFWDDRTFRLIELDENLGFAKANNIAAGQATGRIIHFLNPDTELAPGITQDYLQALLHPEFVYVNPLVNRNGSLENDRMPIPVLRNIRLWNAGSAEAQYWYKGASVIISTDNFRRIGGWCEDYFMYAEDLDLFYMLWQHDIRIQDARTKIFHLGGGCLCKCHNKETVHIRRRVVLCQPPDDTLHEHRGLPGACCCGDKDIPISQINDFLLFTCPFHTHQICTSPSSSPDCSPACLHSVSNIIFATASSIEYFSSLRYPHPSIRISNPQISRYGQ